MAATPLPVVTILADDLTGACDTGCLFAGAGPVAVVISPIRAADDRPVIAVDTETRTLPDAAAAGALRDAAALLRVRLRAGPRPSARRGGRARSSRRPARPCGGRWPPR